MDGATATSGYLRQSHYGVFHTSVNLLFQSRYGASLTCEYLLSALQEIGVFFTFVWFFFFIR